MYGHLVRPEWKTLEVIANAELSIHTIVRSKNPGAAPPVLLTTRTSPHELELRYRSARKMCFLAKGIALGLAKHYGERITLKESKCMHSGDAMCEITIVVQEA